MQGENVYNFILLLRISVNKLFKGNECFSIAVYCNCLIEKNVHLTEASKIENWISLAIL